MTDAPTLIAAKRAFVVAPAGCGKTELIAMAVTLDAGHQNLVLTHTHAGVDALRKRLKARCAAPSSFQVETIAGWSLRLTSAFPNTSGIAFRRPQGDEWDAVYAAAARLLSFKAVGLVVKATFGAVYVDEYQDCSIPQHAVVTKLADLLPTRVLGDPLQAIFAFNGVIDWPTHVEGAFDALPSLVEPYRWRGRNELLGNWLMHARAKLENRQPLDLRHAPRGSVEFMQLPLDPRQRQMVQRQRWLAATCPAGETLLAVRMWEGQCHELARQSGGKFRSPETIECTPLLEHARCLDSAPDGRSLARAVFDFACLCLTKVKGDLGATAERLFDGRGLQNGRVYRLRDQLEALSRVVEDRSSASVQDALVSLGRTPGANKVRHELFGEMMRALREHDAGSLESFEEAATLTRDRTRRTGRSPGRYVVSRTLLVKGLEFDHVLILDASELNQKHLYVALTRGSRSLTILGPTPILNPA